ncbi:MAG: pyridoxal phosphate-dependent aminotransferase [Planctomycetota bacterium]
MLSQHVRTIEPSATLAVNNLRLKLQAEGRKIYNFGAGEPDFGTADFIVEAGIKALRDGWTRYTPVAGVPELRAAIADELARTRRIDVAADQVIVTSGAKQACAEFFESVVDPGDEVLLIAPFWVSYPDMIRLADGIPVPVLLRAEGGYLPTPADLEPFVTPRTTGLVINSPNNPTGAVYSAARMQELVAFAAAHDLWILSDEIYDRFVYEGEFVSPATGNGLDRITIVGGMSKTFAMTGWRIGWAVGAKDLVNGMTRLQGHIASNATAVSQIASVAALRSADQRFFTDQLAKYAERRSTALALLKEIPGITLTPPAGAFYLFLDFSKVLGREGWPATSGALCQELLEKRGVALVPGEAFGDPKGARLSYSCSLDEIREGIGALGAYMNR